MRLIILAYNPQHISNIAIERMQKIFQDEFDCFVYFIPHMDSNAEPIYCVQFADTK